MAEWHDPARHSEFARREEPSKKSKVLHHLRTAAELGMAVGGAYGIVKGLRVDKRYALAGHEHNINVPLTPHEHFVPGVHSHMPPRMVHPKPTAPRATTHKITYKVRKKK